MRERNKRSVKNSRLANDVGNGRFKWASRLHFQRSPSEVDRRWQSTYNDRRHPTDDTLRYDPKFNTLPKGQPWLASQKNSRESMREQTRQDVQHHLGNKLLSGDGM